MLMNDETLSRAADTLRAWALDEDLKARVLAHPEAAAVAKRAALRYIAGEDAASALRLLEANTDRGHRWSIELVGESVRDARVADEQTAEFIDLARRISESDQTATISLDLSHIGSVVSPELGLRNGLALAQAARDAGTSLMISAEGSDRTDLVLSLFEQIADRFPETGITLQARLHRTPADLDRVLHRPGPIRVVKGAFLESTEVAYPRDSAPMTAAYISMVTRLVGSGHRVNLATHDANLVAALEGALGDDLRQPHVEFEMLQGLGTELLDDLRRRGFATREYLVYGPEWWLYVLNRIAEHPERVIEAIADIGPIALLA
ncbi:proline dehydrogenase family protein [Plantibacter flavus]|uniref:proline dehydrogenase family protein n=1 Tax=Plantibacter flavus TaxID=150123 RepID=UPI00237844F0|nr:proline dehydrogenase family protein [Plantibacter flavus]MDD9151690.1 proline dehydrogenase family protein [Plantibacter flavus]